LYDLTVERKVEDTKRLFRSCE